MLRSIALCLSCALVGLLLAGAAAAKTVTVAIGSGPARPPVPDGFLGLSFESYSLPLIASYAHQGNFVNLIDELPPGVMRFSGDSVETALWGTAPDETGPLWDADTIAPSDLSGLAQVAQQTGWGVLLGLSLGSSDTSEIDAAVRALGPSLLAFEMGNEPDLYPLHGHPWAPGQYAQDIATYAYAANQAGPVPVVGPDVAHAHNLLGWLNQERQDLTVDEATGHFYGLNCANGNPVTIGMLLSAGVRAKESSVLGSYVRKAASAGLPFRLDETNSVACGGVNGVSNTFASALYMTDFLVRAMALGVDGVNVHGLIQRCTGYSPLCGADLTSLAAGNLRVQPVWYALLLARNLIGDRVVPVSVKPRPSGLSVWALRSPGGGIHLVVINEGRVSARLHIGAPHFSSATTLRLRAPSLSAETGVTLGGASVSSDGRWAPPALPAQTMRHHRLEVSVGGDSAALVTLQR